MSFAMRKNASNTGAVDPLADPELERFHANLSQGLHAMGQPLTILRWAVVASAAPGITAEERQRYQKMSAEQVELICSLFNCLREFVNTSQFAANSNPVVVSELLSSVVQEQSALLKASGIGTVVMIPEVLPLMNGDPHRTSAALIVVLKVAASVSSPDDVLELLAHLRDGRIQLTVRNKRAHGKHLNSAERLNLALAEANIRSQQGEFDFVEDPLSATISLPVEENVPLKNQDAPYEAYARQVN